MAHVLRLIIAFVVCWSAVSPATAAGVVPASLIYCDQYDIKCGTVDEIVSHWQSTRPTENCSSPPATLGLSWYAKNVTPAGGELWNKRGACPGYQEGRDSRQFGIYPIGGEACPANSTKVGSDCVCETGYAAQDGRCVPVSSADEWCWVRAAYWNSTLHGTNSREGVVKSKQIKPLDEPWQTCRANDDGFKPGGEDGPPGCLHTFTPQMRYRMSEDEPWIYSGDSWAVGTGNDPSTGLACIPGLDDQPGEPPVPKEEKPPEKCKGIPGQVNGVDVCIDPSSAHTEGVTWTQVTDAEGRTRDIKQEVKCEGEKCTVKTTNKTPGSSDPGNGTTTTTTRGQYCAKNPEASICKGETDKTGSTRNQNGRGGAGDPAGGGGKGKGGGNGDGDGDGDDEGSSFGGSCKSNFTCEGDAIQCAIAREQHIRACKMFDDPSDESQLYDQHKGKEGNQTDDLPGNDTVSLSGGGMIDTSDALGGGSCIADKTVTVWDRSVTLPFSQVCADLAMFGNLLVAVSMLLAGRIVTRG